MTSIKFKDCKKGEIYVTTSPYRWIFISKGYMKDEGSINLTDGKSQNNGTFADVDWELYPATPEQIEWFHKNYESREVDVKTFPSPIFEPTIKQDYEVF